MDAAEGVRDGVKEEGTDAVGKELGGGVRPASFARPLDLVLLASEEGLTVLADVRLEVILGVVFTLGIDVAVDVVAVDVDVCLLIEGGVAEGVFSSSSAMEYISSSSLRTPFSLKTMEAGP